MRAEWLSEAEGSYLQIIANISKHSVASSSVVYLHSVGLEKLASKAFHVIDQSIKQST